MRPVTRLAPSTTITRSMRFLCSSFLASPSLTPSRTVMRLSLVIRSATRLVHVGEAHIAIGEDADELAALAVDNREAGNLARFLDQDDFADGLIGMDGDRIDHHAALELLDHLHLVGLLGRGHVAVNDAHAAGLRHGDGEARLGHRIHGGGDERDIELMSRVSRVVVLTSAGSTSDAPGSRSTSSKVKASRISMDGW